MISLSFFKLYPYVLSNFFCGNELKDIEHIIIIIIRKITGRPFLGAFCYKCLKWFNLFLKLRNIEFFFYSTKFKMMKISLNFYDIYVM